MGATNPQESDPGSVRGQYAVSVGYVFINQLSFSLCLHHRHSISYDELTDSRNLIHASDSFDAATKEIGLWFNDSELSEYEPAAWVCLFLSKWTQLISGMDHGR